MEQKWQGFVKPNFGPPPAGYIAGLGRGATGFITRSDIGPAKMQQNPFLKQKQGDDADYSDAKFDQWSGYNAPLFQIGQLDQQDKQAQEVYNFVDKHMDGRRRDVRDKLIKQQLKKMVQSKPSISNQFSDLKRQLAHVSYDQWLNLPDSHDSSIKKQKKQKYVPVPDSMIVGFIGQNKLSNQQTVQGINDLGQAKQIILKSKLDRASDSVSGQTVVDKTGYLTSLNTFKVNDQQYLGDLKKARLLLKSAITTNPKNPETWISAARIEQLDGKLQQARVIINQGVQHCNNSQDLWIQAARLQKPEQSKSIIVKALNFMPKSQKIWLTAARSQFDKIIKRKVLRKALEHLPSSVRLWKQLIQQQQASQAKQLLYKAVECLPKQVDLWLALAKLQNYENAKAILNKARKNNPLQLQIWISAAKLQQTQSDSKSSIMNKIQTILQKANQVLTKNGSVIRRQDWLQQAGISEKNNNLITCEVIVKICYALGIQNQQLDNILAKDCQTYAERGFIHTTRFLYRYGIQKTGSKFLIQRAIIFERNEIKEDQSNFNKILQIAIQKCSDSEQFWQILIDKYIKDQQFNYAMKILDQALLILTNKQNIMLKKAKLYKKLQDYDRAAKLFQQSRQKYGIKSWLASIKFKYQIGNYREAWNLCEILYKKQKQEKVFILAYKIQTKIGTYQDCRNILEKAVQKFDKSVKLWLHFVQLQINHNYIPKARTILQKARVKIPKNIQLHQASIRLQLKDNNQKAAIFLLSKAMSQCPKSGELWALAIQMESRAGRKRKASQGMTACGQDPLVNLAVAKIFWKQKKLQRAKKWLQKTLLLGPCNGDAWCYFYKFVLQNEQKYIIQVLKKIKTANIKEGRLWNSVKKSENGWRLSIQEIIKQVLIKIDEQMQIIE